jgi:hypothetical protein
MRPAAIAACIIILIIVVKDPRLVSEVINGIVKIFSTPGGSGGG